MNATDILPRPGSAMTEPNAEPTVSPRDGRSRLRSLLAALVISALAAIGVVATAPQASAATFTSTATVCFQQTGGGAYTGPTQMWAYTSGGWALLQTMPATNSGCRTWATPDNLYVQFVVNYTSGSSTWTSASNVYYNPPRQNSHFGTYLVTWRVRK